MLDWSCGTWTDTAVVENAIRDKNVVVAVGATVGVDKEHDRGRGLVVSAGGITVVGKV